MGELIKVGMADFKICSGTDGLTTLGLGSCVGIAIRDTLTHIGGLAHVMLPDSTAIRRGSDNIPKFADTAIREMVRQMEEMGARRSRMTAKLAGGAMMFAFQNKSDLVRVGERNVEASKEILQSMQIPVIAEDTGETYGRTVIFYPETGDYVIRAVGKPEKTI